MDNLISVTTIVVFNPHIHYNKYIKRRTPTKNSSEKQLKIDIKYLKKVLDNNKEAIDEVLEHIEKVGIGSAQYFCEEFVFIPDGETPEQVARLHDPLYFDISEFNYHNWEGN